MAILRLARSYKDLRNASAISSRQRLIKPSKAHELQAVKGYDSPLRDAFQPNRANAGAHARLDPWRSLRKHGKVALVIATDTALKLQITRRPRLDLST